MGQHIRITLTPEQKENIKERIQSTSERNIADRLRAVLYKADGYENKEIAYLLQLESINTVTNWLHIYDQQGLDSLCTFKYAGSEPYLNEEQCSMLIFQLKTHIYHTAKQVIAWVMEQFDIQYSLRGMHILLRRLGFTYKKGRLVPSKADPEIQRQFVVAYNQLCSQLGPDDRIYFGDAAHFRHNAETTYSWSEVGSPHVIPTNSGRAHHNVIGVYCIQTGESFFIQTPDNINRVVVIELLKGLQENHPASAKIYVILDNARSHHAKDVSLYCASSNIILVFLPTYSPNLNVIERLWKFLRKKVFKDHYYATLDQFVSAIKDFLTHLERYIDELVTLMTDNFEIIPSAWLNLVPVANSQI